MTMWKVPLGLPQTDTDRMPNGSSTPSRGQSLCDPNDMLSNTHLGLHIGNAGVARQVLKPERSAKDSNSHLKTSIKRANI